jgi:hypothetical protein
MCVWFAADSDSSGIFFGVRNENGEAFLIEIPSGLMLELFVRPVGKGGDSVQCADV